VFLPPGGTDGDIPWATQLLVIGAGSLGIAAFMLVLRRASNRTAPAAATPAVALAAAVPALTPAPAATPPPAKKARTKPSAKPATARASGSRATKATKATRSTKAPSKAPTKSRQTRRLASS
jgi:hypothetical protein